jgi:cytochrome c553
MSDIAKALSGTQIQGLAQYFSQQTNKNTGQPNTPLAAQGKKIYHGGVSGTNVPACAACHGPAAIGLPPLYPRLAGQNSPYVESQLLAFRGKKRSNDPRAIMRDIADKLTTREIKAVATYLGSLP